MIQEESYDDNSGQKEEIVDEQYDNDMSDEIEVSDQHDYEEEDKEQMQMH